MLRDNGTAIFAIGVRVSKPVVSLSFIPLVPATLLSLVSLLQMTSKDNSRISPCLLSFSPRFPFSFSSTHLPFPFPTNNKLERTSSQSDSSFQSDLAEQQAQLSNVVDTTKFPTRLRLIDSIGSIPQIVDAFSQDICTTPDLVPCCSSAPATVNVAAGTYRYIAPSCTKGEHDLIITLTSTDAGCWLFASNSTATPGPLENSAYEVSSSLVKTLRIPASSGAVRLFFLQSCHGGIFEHLRDFVSPVLTSFLRVTPNSPSSWPCALLILDRATQMLP